MTSKNTFLKIAILSVLFGLAAGVVGQLVSTAYLLPKEVLILGENGRIRKTAAEIEENEKIAEAHRITAPTIFEIYLQKPASRDPLGQIYLPKERVAFGVILTSDGWLASFGKNLTDPKDHFIVVTADQKIFSPQKIIFDEATEATFLKIETQNLPVPKLGEYGNLALGEKVIIPFGKQSMKITQIENLAYEKNSEPKDLIKSSEKFSKSILFKDNLNANEIGAPIVNLNGEVVGIASGPDGTGTPINFWRSAFLTLLKNNQIKRPYLGARYLNLAKAIGLSETISQNKIAGALIWGDKNLQIKGAEKNSPAAKAGLRDGDIILKINDEEISQKIDLAEIIQKYSPDDILELTILRDKKEKTVEVTLGEKL